MLHDSFSWIRSCANRTSSLSGHDCVRGWTTDRESFSLKTRPLPRASSDAGSWRSYRTSTRVFRVVSSLGWPPAPTRAERSNSSPQGHGAMDSTGTLVMVLIKDIAKRGGVNVLEPGSHRSVECGVPPLRNFATTWFPSLPNHLSARDRSAKNPSVPPCAPRANSARAMQPFAKRNAMFFGSLR